MKREPLKHHREPEYPEREQAPEATQKFVPARWRTNGAVAGAAAMLLMPAQAKADPPAPPASAASDDKRKPVQARPAPPVFEHGNGFGVFGCVAAAPPAFMTESDARQVILEELGKAGVEVTLDARDVPAVPRYTHAEWEAILRGSPLPAVGPQPTRLDGWEPSREFGFEYISLDDYMRLLLVRLGGIRWRVDLKRMASLFAQETARENLTVAVFYDPMIDRERRTRIGVGPDGAIERTLEPPHPAPPSGPPSSADALRLQVRDFIAWLRAQKILPPAPENR